MPTTPGCPSITADSQYNGTIFGVNIQGIRNTTIQCTNGALVITERVNGNR